MKKIYTLVAMLLITGYIFTQSINHRPLNNFQAPLKLTETDINNTNTAIEKYLKNENKSTIVPGWFSYAEAWDDSLWGGNIQTGLASNYIFPDTLIRLRIK